MRALAHRIHSTAVAFIVMTGSTSYVLGIALTISNVHGERAQNNLLVQYLEVLTVSDVRYGSSVTAHLL